MHYLAIVFLLAFNCAVLANQWKPKACVGTFPPKVEHIKEEFYLKSTYGSPFLEKDCTKIDLKAVNDDKEFTVPVIVKEIETDKFTAKKIKEPYGNYEITVENKSKEEHTFIFIAIAENQGFVLLGCKSGSRNEPEFIAAVFDKSRDELGEKREADINRVLSLFSLDLKEFKKVDQSEGTCKPEQF